MIDIVARRDRSEFEDILKGPLRKQVVWSELILSPWPLFWLIMKTQTVLSRTEDEAHELLRLAGPTGRGIPAETRKRLPGVKHLVVKNRKLLEKARGTLMRRAMRWQMRELGRGVELDEEELHFSVTQADPALVLRNISVGWSQVGFEAAGPGGAAAPNDAANASLERSIPALLATRVTQCFDDESRTLSGLLQRRSAENLSVAALFLNAANESFGTGTRTSSEAGHSLESVVSFVDLAREATDPIDYSASLADYVLAFTSRFRAKEVDPLALRSQRFSTVPDQRAGRSSGSYKNFPFPFFNVRLFYHYLARDFCSEFLFLYAMMQLAHLVEFSHITPGFVIRWIHRFVSYPELIRSDGYWSRTDTFFDLEHRDRLEDEVKELEEGGFGCRATSCGILREETSAANVAEPQIVHPRASSFKNFSSLNDQFSPDAHDLRITLLFRELRRAVGTESLVYLYSSEFWFWLAMLVEKEYRMKLANFDIEDHIRRMDRQRAAKIGTIIINASESEASVADSEDPDIGEPIQPEREALEVISDLRVREEHMVATSANSPASTSAGVNATGGIVSVSGSIGGAMPVVSGRQVGVAPDSKGLQQSVLEEQTTPEEKGALLELLQGLHDLCQAFGFPYLISQGTLLGSQRHHELIPWTGDAEVSLDYSYFPFVFVVSLIQSSAWARRRYLNQRFGSDDSANKK